MVNNITVMVNYKAAPKGLKSINSIYDAQIKQNIINRLVQKSFLREYAHTREKNKIKNKLTALNQNLAGLNLNPYEMKPRSFYSKTNLAKAVQ